MRGVLHRLHLVADFDHASARNNGVSRHSNLSRPDTDFEFETVRLQRRPSEADGGLPQAGVLAGSSWNLDTRPSHRADGPRDGRRRLDQHPRFVLRSLRLEANACPAPWITIAIPTPISAAFSTP